MATGRGAAVAAAAKKLGDGESRLDLLAEAVVDHMEGEGLKRGDMIETEVIERITRLRRRLGQWITVIEKIKRLFRSKTGIELWPINGQGYRLCTVEEQVNLVPRERQRRARRQIRKGIEALDALRGEALTDHQSRVRGLRLSHMEGTLHKIDRDLREQRQAEKISPPNMGDAMRRLREIEEEAAR